MVDFWSLGNGFVLAFPPGAEWGKSPVFKGFSHGENGFVLSKKENAALGFGRRAKSGGPGAKAENGKQRWLKG
jgi:hypothetical protein